MTRIQIICPQFNTTHPRNWASKQFVQPEAYYTPIRHIQFPHPIYKIRAQALFCKLQALASAPASLGTHVEVLFLLAKVRVIYHHIPVYLGTFQVRLSRPAIPPSMRRLHSNHISVFRGYLANR